MDRGELLKRLSQYKTVPGHGPDLDKLTDEKLEFQLKLYESMFEDYFQEDKRV